MTGKFRLSDTAPDTDQPAEKTPGPTVGAAIAIGAGIGLVGGLLSDNPLFGLLIGAGLGVVAGAVRSTHRPPRAP